jgi:transposase-like protein
MARATGPRKVHRYSGEFKLKAVKLSELDGVQVQDVAAALDIHPFICHAGARRRAKAGSRLGRRWPLRPASSAT